MSPRRHCGRSHLLPDGTQTLCKRRCVNGYELHSNVHLLSFTCRLIAWALMSSTLPVHAASRIAPEQAPP
jgi:hypothetical protein